jgi:hypothetical protein
MGINNATNGPIMSVPTVARQLETCGIERRPRSSVSPDTMADAATTFHTLTPSACSRAHGSNRDNDTAPD